MISDNWFDTACYPLLFTFYLRYGHAGQSCMATKLGTCPRPIKIPKLDNPCLIHKQLTFVNRVFRNPNQENEHLPELRSKRRVLMSPASYCFTPKVTGAQTTSPRPRVDTGMCGVAPSCGVDWKSTHPQVDCLAKTLYNSSSPRSFSPYKILLTQ